MRKRGLGKQGEWLIEVGQGRNLFDRFDPIDRIGSDGHGADGLFMAFMADVDDLVALARSNLHLMMDLGNQRADRIDDVASPLTGRRHDGRGRTVC